MSCAFQQGSKEIQAELRDKDRLDMLGSMRLFTADHRPQLLISKICT